MAQNWYAFKNAPDKDGEVELSLYDEIGSFGIGAKQFIAELKEYKGQHVHLRINSPGGEIVEGSAIYNALSRHEGGLTVHIDALAASMASSSSVASKPAWWPMSTPTSTARVSPAGASAAGLAVSAASIRVGFRPGRRFLARGSSPRGWARQWR